MARRPEIGNVQIYPQRPLRSSDKNGFVLKFYCPLLKKRIRRNCGTRDRREARRIQRECRERLLNGEYVESRGAITKEAETNASTPICMAEAQAKPSVITWDDAFEQYRRFKKNRLREKSYEDMHSRVGMARRIFEVRRADDQLEPEATIAECASLESLEYLQDRLLDGAEGRYDSRLPITVNSIIGDVMAFVRYCFDHEWIAKVPPLKDLPHDEAMLGRPITDDEFGRMLDAAAKVVGNGAASSWCFLLRLLWESGFRLADVLNFSWDDETKIHPRWPTKRQKHATIIIPSTQKNKKTEEIPMLPGLQQLLKKVPKSERTGQVLKLVLPAVSIPGKRKDAFTPGREELAELIVDYSNCSIATACNVSERAVRTWLTKHGLTRSGRLRRYGQQIPAEVMASLKSRMQRQKARSTTLSRDRVGRMISAIGEMASIVVRQPDKKRGIRIKYASAHDLRRSLAERLYNSGISAETLMVIMRHQDFSTTRKFYAARRRAESAAVEIESILGGQDAKKAN